MIRSGIALVLLLAAAPLQAAAVGGTITRVSDGQPAVGAQVTLVQQVTPFQEVARGTTTVGASGTYSFLDEFSGVFYVRAELAPLLPARAVFSWNFGNPPAVIDIALSSPSSITAVVVNAATQQPVPGAIVRFVPPPGSFDQQVVADAQGRATLTGVAGGAWRICVRDNTDAFVDECQDNQHLPIDGAIEGVATRAIGSGVAVEIPLALDAGARISGHVTDRYFNAPAEGLIQFTYYAQNAGYLATANIQLGAGGSYTLAGIPPGTYRLSASGSGANFYTRRFHPDVDCGFNNGSCDPTSGTVFNIAGTNVIGAVDFSLQPGAVVKGVVRAAAPAGTIAGATVRVYKPLGIGGWGETGRTVTGPDGSYAVAHLQGTSYRVGAWATGRFAQAWPSFACYSEPCASGDTLTLASDQVSTTIDFSLAEGATVSGRVAGESTGVSLPAASVVVRRTDNTLASEVLSGVAGFETYGLPPGAYFAFATRFREGVRDCEVYLEKPCAAGDPIDPALASLIVVGTGPTVGIVFTLPDDELLRNGFE